MDNTKKTFEVSTPFSSVTMDNREILRKFKLNNDQAKRFSALAVGSTLPVGKTNIIRKT